MGLSASSLLNELGLVEKGHTGFYLGRALSLPSSDARFLPDKMRIGVFAFLRYVALQDFASRDSTFLGDELVGLYDESIKAVRLSQATLDHRRNSCVAIVNLAQNLARADGYEVGPIGLRRPLYDPRSGAVATTLQRLATRGEFGQYLTRALEAKCGNGEYQFGVLVIPLIRVFVKLIEETDPESLLQNADQLSSIMVKEFKDKLEQSEREAKYRRKCVRLADRLMVGAMQLAAYDGKTVGTRFAIPYSDDRPRAEPQAARNGRRIDKIEQLGPLQEQIAAAFRSDAARLVPGSIHGALTNIQPLLRYLDAHPDITCMDDLSRVHLAAIAESISAGDGQKVTKRGVWSTIKRTLTLVEELGVQGPVLKSKIPWPTERWMSERTQRGNADQGLTPVEAADLERLARVEINEVVSRREHRGQLFPGPYVEDLQAFELLLAFRTGFNPSTLRTLKISDIRETEDNVEVCGTKLRSIRQPFAAFAKSESPFSGPWLLKKIEFVTSLARERALPQDKDSLFLFERTMGAGQGRVRPFEPQKNGAENRMLADFGRRAGIEGLTLRTMRASFSNLAFAVSGDDVPTVQRVMGHRGSRTTEDYSRDHTKGPRQEMLGEAMERRLRDARTDMRRDSRDRPMATLSGATPGFACLDPYRPPEDLLQLPGMCAAYGSCPTCPQACVDVSLPSSACDLVLLSDAIRTWIGRQDADPRRVFFWRQQLDALESVWLPRFPIEVLAGASRIRTVRKPVDADFLHD